MSGPWEKYQAAAGEAAPAAVAAEGPWTKYAATAEPAAEPPAPDRTVVESVLRQLGLTARATITGAATIPAMLADGVTGAVNSGLDAVAGEGKGFRFQPAQQALGRVMTAAGLPEPENATERVVQDIGSSAVGAGGFVKAGQVLSKAASPVAAAVGDTLAKGAGLQVTSAATGGGASGVTRESGGGTGAQVAAGLVGALTPGFAGPAGKALVRGALRGGEAGRAKAAANFQAFEEAGTVPTLAQATEGRMARATEALVAKAPGGAGVIAKRAQQQIDDMDMAVQRLSDELAPGASAINAGEAIERGIQTFKNGIKEHQGKLYGALDNYLPSNTPIAATSTQQALKELTADIPGAPALSDLFRNAKLVGLSKSLQADLDNAATTGALPYRGLKELRSVVGRELANNSLVPDVPRAQWSKLYGALSDDLGVAAKNAGPEAEQAWQWANTFTRMQMARLEKLDRIVSKDTPELVFSSATAGTNEGNTLVARVLGALPKAEKREVAAAVLQRLGRATAGQQNAANDAFSSETFLTNLSKLSPAARKTIFGHTGLDGLEERVATFAKVAESRREGGRVFANPSGTAGATTQIAYGASLGGAIATALTTGNLGPLVGVLAVPAASYGLAKVVSSPGLARFAADATELAPGALASAVGAAAQLDDGAEPLPLDMQSEFGQQPQTAPASEFQPEPQALPPAAPPEVAPALPPTSAIPPSMDAASAIAAIGSASTVDEAIAAAAAAVVSEPIAPPAAPEPPPPPAQVSMALPQAQGASFEGEPDTTWYGRRGDGYQERGDVELALRTRQKANPELDWRVEQMPNGRYRLGGYAPASQDDGMGAMAAAPEAAQPGAFRGEMRPDGTLSVTGEPDLVRNMLAGFGINGIRTQNGLLIGRGQAGAAMQILREMAA